MQTDVLIIGSGLAGLFCALNIPRDLRIIVVTKKNVRDGATYLAQGGIAAVVAPEDNIESHIEDTISAGSYLNKTEIVRMVVSEGPERVKELIEYGVNFTKETNGDFDLGMEGGHSHRRVLHAMDQTGRVIEDALIDDAYGRENLTLLENHMALTLITDKDGGRCTGAYVLDTGTNEVIGISARQTVLATGGCGRVYLITSNPDVATGDGIAIAYRAGAEIANMEFMQFHPTCFFRPGAATERERSFLITEAVRGEGGILINEAGKRFLEGGDPRMELAPRDIVARAIDAEMKHTGENCVYLDISQQKKNTIIKRFPNIYRKCLEFGVDITSEPIQVAPAAHYCCGGIETDENGRSSVPALYAVGEAACSGMHGANRLASNSLLEASVFGYRAGQAIASSIENVKTPEIPETWETPPSGRFDEVEIAHEWNAVRRLMRDYVGIVRTDNRLHLAMERVNVIGDHVEEMYRRTPLFGDLIELRNITCVASMIIASAQQRKESRGLHYNLDWMEQNDDFKRDTVITKNELRRS
ncbi:MAG: L-aspartate oxidase [bacterium]|nr:L-aspartate oxidase [bacterium]